MKTICQLCESKTKRGIIISEDFVCSACIRKDSSLKRIVADIKYIQSKVNEDNTAKAFALTLSEEQNLVLKAKEIIKSKSKDDVNLEKLKKEIIEKVEVMNQLEKKTKITPEAKQNITKCLNGLGQAELQECAESIKLAETYSDLHKVSTLKRLKQDLDIPNPKDIYEEIKLQIINQDHAIKTISRAVSKHFCRIKDKTLKKQNIMILGPTGTGKTEICRILAKKIKLPFVTVDATSFTATGYKGNTASEVIISSLLTAAKGEVKLAEYGIVFIDEIDKKATRNSQNAADIGTASVQQELLKIIEGGLIKTETTDERGINKKIELDTTNVLFIVAGAFSGIEKLVNKTKVSGLGLMKKEDVINSSGFDHIQTKDLISYGFMPEFLGRFSSITYTLPLSKEDLIGILTVPENNIITQYKKMFSQCKVNIDFSKEFLETIAEDAAKENIGARGLDRIFERKMEETFFNIYDYIGEHIIIDKEGNVHVYSKNKNFSI